MDLSERLTELKQAKRNQDTLDDLKALLSMSKKDKDGVLAMEALMQVVETERYMRNHDGAIAVLEEELSQDFFNSQEDRIKIIEEMIKTLLRTEDFVKLESVLRNRERYLTNDHQKVMQKFYYAVCYEGLKEHKKAIEVLKSIKDTISSSNLVSKYLKLSMLYLKENNLSLARENFHHAEKFDKNHNNPIFCLAESDIMFAEEDYLGALNKYQEYFIKSKNKHRYLDRFILINIKLERTDEAWKFYHEYFPIMSSIISKNYRLIFYEAGLELAKKLNNRSEIEKLSFLIDELEPSRPLLDRFDSVYRLLSIAFQKRITSKPRDVILNLFRALDELYKFQKLVYLVPFENGVKSYYFQKNLLLEKDIPNIDLSSTIVEDILKSKPVNEIYKYDDLIRYSHQFYKTVDTVLLFANGIDLNMEFGYFLVYSTNKEDFDFQQKLVLLAANILQKQLRDLESEKSINELNHNLVTLIDRSNLGLIKIENNIIHFLNATAKKLFGVKQDYLAFEDFQKTLDRVLFIDDFLYTEEIIIGLVNSQKLLKMTISKSDFTIYAVVSEVIEETKSMKLNSYYEIGDETMLLNDNKDIEIKTIILFEIRNYLNCLKEQSIEKYNQILTELFNFIKTTSRNHYDKLYLESYNLVYLTLKTVDKRVLNRIMDSVLDQFPDLDIYISSIQVSTILTKEKLTQMRYLLSLAESNNRIVLDNRNYRYHQERGKTVLLNVNSFIQKKSVPLAVNSISDWHTNKPRFWLAKTSQTAMLGDEDTLKQVLKANDLEAEWDNLVALSLTKEIKKYNLDGEFLISVDSKTIADQKQASRLVRRATEANIGFVINLDSKISKEELSEFRNLTASKELILVGTNFLKMLTIEDIDLVNSFDFLVLDSKDILNKNLNKFLKMLNLDKIQLILDHGHKTLRKSDLEAHGITLVLGDAYPKHENVTALKN